MFNIFNLFKKDPEVIAPESESRPSMKEVGWSNSLLYASGNFEKYNPDQLIVHKGYEVYIKMMRDDQVKAVMAFKKSAITSRGWYFDIDEDIPEHQEISDFFYTVIDNMKGSFTDALTGCLSALNNGFSITEKVYSDLEFNGRSMWGISRLRLRPFETFVSGFTVDAHGNIEKLKQNQGGKVVELPLDKVIHFVHQPDIDEHYGESDLRACYRNYWSKDIIIKFQNIHLERFASSFIYAVIEKTLSTENKTKLKSLMQNISSRMSAYLPKGVTLESIDPKKTDEYERAIAQHDKAIAKSVLVPNLLGLTEQGNTGSYSQAEIHLEAFYMIIDAIVKRLEDALNEQLFAQLAQWNFGIKEFPKFRFESLSPKEKERVAKSWGELLKAGAVTQTEADEAHIRRWMAFPEKIEDDTDDIPDNEPGDEPSIEDEVDETIKQLRVKFSYTERQLKAIKKQLIDEPWMRRVNFVQAKQRFDESDTMYINDMVEVLAQGRESITNQVIELVGQKSMSNLSPLAASKVMLPPAIITKLRKITRENLTNAVVNGHEDAKKELPKQVFAKAIQPGMDISQSEKFLTRKAFRVAGILDTDVLKAVQQILENGIKYDKTLTEILVALSTDAALSSLLPAIDSAQRAINIPARVETIARTNISDAINQGRQALFSSPDLKNFIQAYQYSAILDDRTSGICEHLNGKILRNFDNYRPPNHFNCRSILVAVTVTDDWDGKESPSPTMKPQEGFS